MRNMARITVAAMAIVLGLLWVPDPADGQSRRALQRFATAPLTIETASGPKEFTVEVAKSSAQQSQGLMFRRRLAADAGMLFVYRRVAPVAMWMQNTFIPLDMLFIGAGGKIVKIVPNTTPLSLDVITSDAPVRAVFEVGAGTAKRLGIKTGDTVEHRIFQ